jgi:predicted enzyme related to lactoylglutathione lyase
VDDVDAAVRAAVAAGGRLLSPAMHVPGVGRRARLADPQGAVFGVVTLDGPDPRDGLFAWNELWTPDPTSALAFYATAFGYYASAVGNLGTYHMLQRGGAPRAGILKAPLCKPGWLPYHRVDVCDDAAARAARNGGTVEIAPTDVPRVGRIAIFRDPLGARLAALQPLPDLVDDQVASGVPAASPPPAASTGRASAPETAASAGRASGVPPLSSSPHAANNANSAKVSRFMRP